MNASPLRVQLQGSIGSNPSSELPEVTLSEESTEGVLEGYGYCINDRVRDEGAGGLSAKVPIYLEFYSSTPFLIFRRGQRRRC